MKSHEALYGPLAELFSQLESEGVEPILVGGLAVGLWLQRELDFETEPTISRLRTTHDIDLAVPARPSVEDLLERLKFRRIREIRFERQGLFVDLLDTDAPRSTGAGAEASDVLALLGDRAERLPLPTLGQRVRVLRPAPLVVLKCVAFANNPERRKDLADLACLAYADRATGRARAELREILGFVDEAMRDAVRQLDRWFASAESPGAIAFASEFSESAGYFDDSEGRDEELREIAHDVVNLLTRAP